MEYVTASVIAALCVFGGAIGGWANYGLSREEEDRLPTRWKAIGAGVAAGLTVPLLLILVQSTLLQNSEDEPATLLAILGLAVLAGFSSRAFLTSMASKALRLAEDADRKATEAESKARELDEDATEPEEEQRIPEVSTTGRKVMRQFANTTTRYRSRTGLSRGTGLGLADLDESLDGLVKEGLLRTIDKTAGRRYALTDLGKLYLAQPGSRK